MWRKIGIALLIYLAIAIPVGFGNHISSPYGKSGRSLTASADVGLLWPVLTIEFVGEAAIEYYRNVMA